MFIFPTGAVELKLPIEGTKSVRCRLTAPLERYSIIGWKVTERAHYSLTLWHDLFPPEGFQNG